MTYVPGFHLFHENQVVQFFPEKQINTKVNDAFIHYSISTINQANSTRNIVSNGTCKLKLKISFKNFIEGETDVSTLKFICH